MFPRGLQRNEGLLGIPGVEHGMQQYSSLDAQQYATPFKRVFTLCIGWKSIPWYQVSFRLLLVIWDMECRSATGWVSARDTISENSLCCARDQVLFRGRVSSALSFMVVLDKVCLCPRKF